VTTFNGASVHTNGLALVANTAGALVPETGGAITPFSGSLITGNPAGAGTTTCEVGAATPIVNCVDATCPQPACPQPSCPQASCPAPVLERTLGECRRCKTKGGRTICTGCAVVVE